MYTEFYNLKEKPFDLSPSSRFLFLGDIHKEALALLTYGVTERKGVILLTGEVGTGKTTIVHALLSNLGEDVRYVYLSNPLFSMKDFMNYLASSVFHKKVSFDSKADFLIHLEHYLKEQLRHQKNFILIIDEAQKLSFELLEEIRLLSNMETAETKLINIFLVGQPELNETLSRPECRPLLQRISIRYHIRTLDLHSTGKYMTTRLKMAGGKDIDKIFPKNVIREIYEYSAGYPRMINILADNVLLLGYSSGEKKITPSMVKECYEDLQLEGSFFEKSNQERNSKEIDVKDPVQKGSKRKWALLSILILLIFVFMLSPQGKDVIGRIDIFAPNIENVVNKIVSDTQQIQENKSNPMVLATAKKEPIFGQETSIDDTKEQIPQKETIEYETDHRTKNGIPDDNEGYYNGDMLENHELEATPTVPLIEATDFVSAKEETEGEETVLVREGDTLTKLIIKTYGYINDDILDLVKKHNPDIENINLIEVGQEIIFPILSLPEKKDIYTVHIASFIPFDKARHLFQDLIEEGYEAYLLPVDDTQRGKLFKVTLGSFKNRKEANDYASFVLSKGISDYANTVQLEMK